MEELQEKLRSLPGIDRLLTIASSQNDLAGLPHFLLVESLRQATELFRSKLKAQPDNEVSVTEIVDQARELLRQVMEPSLKRVINATGVVLHTNLGRAPLSMRAQDRVKSVMTGYCALEYDVTSGERGSRYSHVVRRLCDLTGAEDAIVVNNNAAAVLLVLSSIAFGQEVIVSRGELVEIGGSFRIPDVLRQSGATLVEVGTTNKTHLSDYEQAIGTETAAILKVHTSNYRIIGFTAKPDDAELVALARTHKLPLIEDLGSGTILPLKAGEWHEPTVSERLAVGMDIITFSGDKLFGGAQAGIIAGKKRYIDQMRNHSLLRAIRIDKLSLAALEGTLLDYICGRPEEDIPVQRMLHISIEALKTQAKTLAENLKPLDYLYDVGVIHIQSQVGGGAFPAVDLDSYGLTIKPRQVSTAYLEKILRRQPVPLIVRVQNDRLIIDMRCLTADDLCNISEILAGIGKGDRQ